MPVKSCVVIDPSPDFWIKFLCKPFQCLLAPSWYHYSSNRFSYCCFSSIADCPAKHKECFLTTKLVPSCSWLKTITQKGKAFVIVVFCSLIILAIHNLSLLGMQC